MSDRPTCPEHPYAGATLLKSWRMVCSKCGVFLWWAAPPGLLQRPACPQCQGQKVVRLVRITAANGHDHIVWYCTTCNHYVKDGKRLWLPNALVGEFLTYWNTRLPNSNLPNSLEELPLLKDHSGSDPCAICGEPASEYNHFMPQAFKNDPDIVADWTEWDKLGAWLCDKHHRLWHAKVAPLQALSQMKREAIK